MARATGSPRRKGTPAVATPDAIRLAFLMVDRLIDSLREARADDEDWDSNKDTSIDLAVMLASDRLEEIMASNPITHDDLYYDWLQVSAVIDLAAQAFSRPDTRYGRTLASLNSSLLVLIEMVELAERALEVSRG